MALSVWRGDETRWLIHSPLCRAGRGSLNVWEQRANETIPLLPQELYAGSSFCPQCPSLGICTPWPGLCLIYASQWCILWPSCLKLSPYSGISYSPFLRCLSSSDILQFLTYLIYLSVYPHQDRVYHILLQSDWLRDDHVTHSESVRRNKIWLEYWEREHICFSIGLAPMRMWVWLCWVF